MCDGDSAAVDGGGLSFISPGIDGQRKCCVECRGGAEGFFLCCGAVSVPGARGMAGVGEIEDADFAGGCWVVMENGACEAECVGVEDTDWE